MPLMRSVVTDTALYFVMKTLNIVSEVGCCIYICFLRLNADASGTTVAPSVIYHPLGSVRARNPGVTTEVVSNISRQKKGKDSLSSNYSAICTLDG